MWRRRRPWPRRSARGCSVSALRCAKTAERRCRGRFGARPWWGVRRALRREADGPLATRAALCLLPLKASGYLQPGSSTVWPGGWHFALASFGPPPLLPGPKDGSPNAAGASAPRTPSVVRATAMRFLMSLLSRWLVAWVCRGNGGRSGPRADCRAVGGVAGALAALAGAVAAVGGRRRVGEAGGRRERREDAECGD